MPGGGRGRRWGSVAVGSAALAVAVEASLRFDCGDPLAGIWLGNAVQVAALLVVARRRWPEHLAAFALVQVALVAASGAPMAMVLATTAVNGAESVAAALVAGRDRDWVEGRSDRLADWVRFAAWVVVAIPALGAVVGGAATVLTAGPATADALVASARTWYVADAMALSVIVPVILRLRPAQVAHLRRPDRAVAAGGLLALVAAVAVLAFSTHGFLALSLLPLPLVLLLFRTGFAGLAAGMTVLAPIALLATRAGWGPMTAVAPGDAAGALVACQVFLVSVFATLVVVAALLDERQRRTAMDAASVDLYRIIATTSGDLIVVCEADGYTRYVSPAVDELLGLPPEALLGLAWRRLVHPDDVAAIVDALGAVARGELAGCTFRLRRGDGEWRWFESRIRQSHGVDHSGAHLVVGMFRDVTDRRHHEEGLVARAAELDALARTDPLTGLANRRELDARHEAAWRSAARARDHLGLLIVDVDHFKAYNDRHGHLAGDRCLAAVAAAVSGAATRPGDVCGRYGGEEFVVLLPGADLPGARLVAERVRTAVEALPPHGGVTVSVGASSCRPAVLDRHHDVLFDAADAALFMAKDAGRNAVVAVPVATGPGPGAATGATAGAVTARRG